jgi:DNA polymerase-3 subunit delta
MAQTPAQLLAALKRGPAPLTTIFGDEPLLALETADAFRVAARAAGCSEREVFTAEPGADWKSLGASAANLSLFAERKLIEIRIPTGKPGKDGAQALERYCARLPEDAVTLVLLPDLDWKQQKSAWFGALGEAGVMVEAKPVARENLPAWLAERLARQNQKADAGTLEWLADRVEGNLLAARQEVEKLALLLPEGEVTLDAIRDCVTDVSRFDIDDLTDAVHDGEAARIARVMDSLEAGGEAQPLILWVLAEDLRTMMQLASGERPRRYLPQAKMDRLAKAARRLPPGALARALLQAAHADRMIKGVATGNAWVSLTTLALQVAGCRTLREPYALH